MALPEPNDPELYWAAGFIEGEGSFIFNPTDGCLWTDAAQKEREPLERLQRVLGGGIYWGGDKQNIWRRRSTGSRDDKLALMRLLYPLMSSRRQAQIDRVFRRHRAYAGSDMQRRRNAARAKRTRERYHSDPEFRRKRLAAHAEWEKRNPGRKKRAA